MKYLVISIVSVLIFVASNCFAIDQKIIDGAEAYESAVKDLRKIEIKLETANDGPEYWSKKLNEERSKKGIFYSLHRIQFCQDKIIESKERIRDLGIKYNEAKKEVKRLKPIVDEYNKQVEIEHKKQDFKDTVIHFGKIIGIPIAFLLFIIFLSRLTKRRYKRLLKEGKITQDEYNQIMSGNNKSRLFDDDKGVNPSTGLPLVGNGVCDAGGNIRGSSSRDSLFDHSQDYTSRHRWD